MSPVTLPGNLVSPVAGPLLRRGAPALWLRCHTHPEGCPCLVIEADISDDPEPLTRILCDAQSDSGAWDAPTAGIALDLSDPAGRDRAARWLAAHHGLQVGATAPGWAFEVGYGWRLLVEYNVPPLSNTFHAWRAIALPGISALTDPALALRAACLAAVQK